MRRSRVATEVLDLKRSPRPDASLDTQLLYGESVTVYEDDDGWGWVQAARDGYVGYAAMNALVPGAPASTHRVTVRRTFLYPAPDMKQPVLGALPLDGRVGAEGMNGAFAKIAGHGFVVAAHLAPLESPAPDFVAVAEMLRGTPYLWGGKSSLGIDCSGLVQVAAAVAGRAMPRDTDMQAEIGHSVPVDAALTHLERGDLVFWKGHVGIMQDSHLLIHANAHHMLVESEPLLVARARILASSANEITTVRRLTIA